MAKYKHIVEGTFIQRPNRFLARVLIHGKEEICHVKNTGRCRELLLPGSKVYLEKSDNPNRKTLYDLIGVVKECEDCNGKKFLRMVNMDSQIPNQVAYDWIKEGGLGEVPVLLKREVTFGKSRFDIYGEFLKTNSGGQTEYNSVRKAFVEVKGVTLETDGVVRFPDAPTERGLKHIYELTECRKQGYEAYILFVIQMRNVAYFEPNDATQPEFRRALLAAKEAGVQIMALECDVTENEITADSQVEVRL